jgi:short-subunit dehydrogenase
MQKTILITGCSSGIGYSAAKTLHQRGYRVFAAVRKADDQQRLIAEGLNSILLDVNDSDAIKIAVTEVLQQTNGELYALFNNAGFGQPGAVEDLSRDSMRHQFETNVFGLQELTNAVIPTMRKQGYGRIINVSSVLGLVSMAYRGVYCASKFAVEGMTDALRLELIGSGVYVSLIEPGPIESSFRDAARKSWEQHIQAEQSAHKVSYENLLSNMEEMKENSMFTMQPDAVVKKLIHALESKKPKVRYYVTFPTYLFGFLKRFLPSRWMDAIMLMIAKSEVKQPKKNEVDI